MKNRFLILSFCLMIFSCASSQNVSNSNETKKETTVVEIVPSKEIKKMPVETVITFKINMFPKCGDTLSVDGHILSIINNESSCSYGCDEGLLWLYPAKLNIELNPLFQISYIKINYFDGCGEGCTVAKLLDVNGVEIQSQENSLIGVGAVFEFNDNLKTAKMLTISSNEGQVNKITIGYVGE